MARSEGELESKAQEFTKYGIEVATIAKDLFKRVEVFDHCNEHKSEISKSTYWLLMRERVVHSLFDDNDIERELDIIALQPGATKTGFFNMAGMNNSKAVQDKESYPIRQK